jgi:membrane protease YdiL (CAAX protease family)
LACCGRLADKRIIQSAHAVATQRVVRWRFGIGWWLAVLAGLPVLTVIFTLILDGSLESIDPVGLFWNQLRLLLINFILVNLWEEPAWAGVMQTRLEHRHNIFVAAALTAVPFGFIHLPLAFLSEVTLALVLISLAAYILLGLFLRPLVGIVRCSCRESLLAAGQMHSVFNRTNNDNGIAAACSTEALPARGPDRGGRAHRRGTHGRAPAARHGLPARTSYQPRGVAR